MTNASVHGTLETKAETEPQPGGLPSHLCDGLLRASVHCVFAHFHQLFEEQIADLGEASAGRLHESVQYGADVGLDADLKQFFSLLEN